MQACPEPLVSAYDLAMLDLDGVVYVGPDAVPGVAEQLAAARASGMKLAFVTNNAARPPETVSAHLTDLGVAAEAADVVTSAQAAARLVAERVPAGARVYVIGGLGLEQALREHGLEPVQSADPEPAAVVSGYHPDLRWRTVIDGAILVRRGLPWVAANTDRSVPTPLGPGPGNGVLVGAVADFTGVTPVVAGKPEPPLFLETTLRVGGERPLVVGDRLDTDIEGANRAGFDSLLVLTGVTGLAELVRAEPHERPTYLAPTLATLAEPQPEIRREGDDSVLGGWRSRVVGGRLEVHGEGSPSDWWRAVAVAAWEWLDRTGAPADVAGVVPPVD